MDPFSDKHFGRIFFLSSLSHSLILSTLSFSLFLSLSNILASQHFVSLDRCTNFSPSLTTYQLPSLSLWLILSPSHDHIFVPHLFFPLADSIFSLSHFSFTFISLSSFLSLCLSLSLIIPNGFIPLTKKLRGMMRK